MKILAIKTITTKSGSPRILVQTADKDYYPSVKQWRSKGCSDVLDNYIGGDIEASYYKQGELLADGKSAVTKDDTLLKDFTASINPVVLAQSLAAESTMKMNMLIDKSALFNRIRAAEAANKTIS